MCCIRVRSQVSAPCLNQFLKKTLFIFSNKNTTTKITEMPAIYTVLILTRISQAKATQCSLKLFLLSAVKKIKSDRYDSAFLDSSLQFQT